MTTRELYGRMGQRTLEAIIKDSVHAMNHAENKRIERAFKKEIIMALTKLKERYLLDYKHIDLYNLYCK